MRALVYTALVAFLRLVTRVFFRTIEVVGREHVPLDGPVVFVGNHPNSLIDPVLVVTTCGRTVRFAAKDTLFASPPLRPILWALGAVPIKRRQDHDGSDPKQEEKQAKAGSSVDNNDAFDALLAVLKLGGSFGIFPEGISHTRSELAPLKTGAARIALSASELGIPVRIVPCGLTYVQRQKLRSRVLVQFGAPLVVDEERLRALQADPKQAAKVLTADIEAAMRGLTINVPDYDTLRVLDGVRRLYEPTGMKLTLAERAEIMRRLVAHWEKLKELPDVAAFYRDASAYLDQLDALALHDRDLRGPISALARIARLVRHVLFFAVLVPFALPGLVLHLPVLGAAVVAGETLTQRGDVKATIKMIAATLLVLATYVVVTALVLVTVAPPQGLVAATIVLGGLLLSGWATIKVLERQATLRRGFSLFFTLLHLEDELLRLAVVRDGLRARLLAFVDQHLDPGTARVVDKGAQDDTAWLDDEDAGAI